MELSSRARVRPVMRCLLAVLLLALTSCAAARPHATGASRGTSAAGQAASPVPPGGQTASSELEPAPVAGPRRLVLEDDRCALIADDHVVLAPPCLLDLSTREVSCLLPDAAMPRFVALDPRSDAPPRGFTRASLGPARDIAASSSQLCVVDDDGAVSCRRPGAQARPIPELPPMAALALGDGCGEILCGISEASELVCVATAARAGAVRVPEIAAVSVRGCTVCMASLDGRVACFGSAEDAVPFASSPRVLAGRVCERTSPGPSAPVPGGSGAARPQSAE